MPKYLSGRSKVTPQSKLQSDRYRYLSIENAEPNLGDPLVGLSSVTAKPVPPGQQFIIVSVEGYTSGERYWIPNQGGIIPGSISVFDDNTLVGALSSITQLNFVGAAITASISIASSNLATIRVFSPGNNQEIIFNTANEFSTSTKLKFDPSNGLLTAGDRIIVGAGGTVITTTGIGSVGIGTTDPTQELHLQGDLRLTGTIYDFNNQPGTNAQILVKNNFGGLTWINQDAIRSGAGGTYQQVQFHNSSGLIDGALNFVFDDINSRIGIGSTQPKVLLDVLGISSFKGGTTIDNLIVTGITTTQNLQVTGVSTVGFVTGTSAFFTGIVTATKFVGELNVSNLYVTGISTLLQKVNIDSDLGVTGLTTTQNLQVYQSTTLNRLNAGLSTFTTVDINGGEIDVTRIGTQNLNVSGVGTFSSQVNINNLNVTGVGTFDNIKLESNTISTNVGNLILDSSGGTTQINDAIFVNDSTQSNDKDQGSIVTQGGVGIEKNLNVGEQLSVVGVTTLASNGGITTTGGDLYVGGDLYIKDDIFYDEISGRRAEFTEFLKTKDFQVTGIATIKDLGVSGLTTTRNLKVIGISTFDNYIDANGGAYIDNIQIGITGDNEIDTTSGNLTIDSAGGTTTIDDQLIVSGISTFNNVTESTTTTNGSLIVSGGAGIAKNLNLGNNLTVSGTSTFNGNVTFGDDANTDTVSFTSKINSSVLPSTNSSSGIDGSGKDLGGASNYWRKVYANEFVGAITGNANTASQIAAITRSTDATHYLTFVDSDNSPAAYENLYTNSGVTYNPSTGRFGIGTTIPIRILHLSQNSAAEFIIEQSNSRADFKKWNFVADGGSAEAGTTGNFYLRLLNDAGNATSKLYWYINGSNNTQSFYDTVLINSASPTGTASQPLQVTGGAYVSGSLGVGVENPGVKLDIYSPSSSSAIRATIGASYAATLYHGAISGLSTNAASAHSSQFAASGVGATSGELGVYSFYPTFANFPTDRSPRRAVDLVGGFATSTWGTEYFAINVGRNGTANDSAILTNERLRIDGSGNVGIGITNPTSKLHVSGTSLITGITTFGSNVLPSGANQNIGSESQKWDYVYANNFSGPITGNVNGNADTASQVAVVSNETDATFYPTFVNSNNNPAAYESLHTDGGISYNPSTNLLSIGGTINSDNLTVTNDISLGKELNFTSPIENKFIDFYTKSSGGTNYSATLRLVNHDSTSYQNAIGMTRDGAVTLYYNGSDKLSTTNTGISVNGSITGQVIGNADTATKLATPREIDISGDVIGVGIGTTFDGSQNVTIPTVLSTTGVSSATYGSATTVPQIAVDTKGRITSASNVNIDFSKASYADNAGIATHIKGGTPGSIPYQTGLSTTAFLAASVTNGAILTYDTTLVGPKWVTSSSFSGNATYADNAGIATNLKSLSTNTGQIPYQSAVSTTLFTTSGVSGVSLLQYNGSSGPTWVSPTNLTVQNATFATNAGIATNLKSLSTNNYAIPYQSAASITSFLPVGTSGQILQSRGNTDSPIWIDANTTASKSVVASDAENLPRYITFAPDVGNQNLGIDKSHLIYNPSSNILSAQKISITNILSGSTTIATFNANGQQVTSLGVGAATPPATSGEIRASNNITAYASSDIKLKTNIKPITEPIKKLSQINGVSFDWKDDYIAERGGEDGYFVRKHEVGVIAQEIEKVLPEIVVTRENGIKAIKYELLAPLLIEAIKEQQDMIINLQRRIEDLEK